jgi:mono/diheme cytochrome c family protein
MGRNLFFLLVIVSLLASCREHRNKTAKHSTAIEMDNDTAAYNLQRGKGKWFAGKLQLSEHIDKAMAAEGERIAAEKCSACHKTNEETNVGPGWKGVTRRRSPEWIMNYISHPQEMIDKDPRLKELLDKCSVRMPDLNLTDVQARQILEFLRKNDRK